MKDPFHDPMNDVIDQLAAQADTQKLEEERAKNKTIQAAKISEELSKGKR